MCSSSPKAPKTPAVLPVPLAPAIVSPMDAEPSSQSAADQERKRRLAASGRSDNILTRGLGIQSEATTGRKRLLGE